MGRRYLAEAKTFTVDASGNICLVTDSLLLHRKNADQGSIHGISGICES